MTPEMNLAIRILHYRKDGRPDRTRWVEVMKDMLNDSRVKVFTDASGTPYTGLSNVYSDIAKDNPTHVLILHHDVLPCFDFIPAVEGLLGLRRDEPMTFYTNSKATDLALKEGVHWLKLKIWYYSQAYAMSFPLMKDMISWINANVNQDDRNSDDERMAMYFYFHNRFVYATVPSLVEHIGWNSTTVDYDRPMKNYLDNKEHRMARKFIGIDQSPLTIDWSKGLESPIIDEADWALENSDTLFSKLLKSQASE